MMCFIELVKHVGQTTIHQSTQLFTLNCVSFTIDADVEGERKLPRRSGDVGNGPCTATGHEEVNQSDTVSIPADVPGQHIPMRVIASDVCKQSMLTCMKLCVMKEKTRLPYILDHVRDKCDIWWP